MFSFLINPGNTLECDGLRRFVTTLQEPNPVTSDTRSSHSKSLTVVYLVCWVAQYLDWTNVTARNVTAPIAETQSVMVRNGKAPNVKVQI